MRLLRVKPEHISKGRKADPHACPIALAGRELFGSSDEETSVGGDNARFGTLKFKLPPAVSDWIFAFDRGRGVCPITVELED